MRGVCCTRVSHVCMSVNRPSSSVLENYLPDKCITIDHFFSTMCSYVYVFFFFFLIKFIQYIKVLDLKIFFLFSTAFKSVSLN